MQVFSKSCTNIFTRQANLQVSSLIARWCTLTFAQPVRLKKGGQQTQALDCSRDGFTTKRNLALSDNK